MNGKSSAEMSLLTVPTKIIPTKQALPGRDAIDTDDEEGGLGYTHTLVSDLLID